MSGRSFAQDNGVRLKAQAPFPVYKGEETSLLGFSGGLHLPYFGQVDLDLDGNLDLVVKDAFSDRAYVFRSIVKGEEIVYEQAIDLESRLPSLLGVFYFIDINGDEKMDLITGIADLTVYINKSDGSVVFERQAKKLSYQAENSREKVTFQPGEQPAIADINGDGHLDILVFNEDGSRVVYYENQTTTKGVFDLKLITNTWGFFEESGINSDIKLGVGKKEGAHPGSKILAFDAEGDGDYDLLISDVTSSKINFLENGKSDLSLAHDSMISFTENYPGNEPIVIPYFPSFNLIDFDLDGDLDLLTSNSTRSPMVNGLIWAYENVGTTGFDFRLKTKSFLQEEMIDNGLNCIPAAADVDGDGDVDLVMSSINHENGDYSKSQFAMLSYYENTGSAEEPEYELKNNDYLGLAELESPFMSPCFGDLDNDGVIDLLVGNASGRLWFFKNQAGPNEAMDLAEKQLIEGLDVGVNARPSIYDVDKDGYNDMVIGEQAGYLNYYTGSSTFEFELQSERWGEIRTNGFFWEVLDTNDQGQVIDSTKFFLPEGNSHPTLADIDGNGQVDMMVGSAWGKMALYMNVDLSKSYFWPVKGWLQLDNHSRQIDKDMGEFTAPYFSDLNADGKPELMIGVYMGGLELFTSDSMVVGLPKVPKPEPLVVYPNPSNGLITIGGLSDNSTLIISNLNGQELERYSLLTNKNLQVELSKGIYVFTCLVGGHVYSKKVVVTGF